jgi:hypothetical protein
MCREQVIAKLVHIALGRGVKIAYWVREGLDRDVRADFEQKAVRVC